MGAESPLAFARYIGIDYSGAETPNSSLKGLRVYLADRSLAPEEVPPPPSPRRYWTRRGIAQWLVARLAEDVPTLVGIDHGFSFPLRYFEVHHLAPDWPTFLEDFQRYWPTDEDNLYVDFVRDGLHGKGADRAGNARWRRLTKERAGYGQELLKALSARLSAEFGQGFSVCNVHLMRKFFIEYQFRIQQQAAVKLRSTEFKHEHFGHATKTEED